MKRFVKGLASAMVAAIAIVSMSESASAIDLEVAAGGAITAGSPTLMTFNQIATADFDEDGLDDVAATTDANGVRVWLADGDGTFSPASTAFFGTNIARSWLETGDFDDDGSADLLVGDKNYPGTMRTFLGNGDGTFGTEAATFDFNGWMPSTLHSLAIGDVDGDGIPDAVAGINSTQYGVALGDGDGSFTVMPGPTTFPVTDASGGAGFGSVAIGDYDDDGNQDLALAIRAFSSVGGVYVAEGAGDGTFTPLATTPVPGSGDPDSAVESIATAHLTSDDADDLTVVLRSGGVSVRTLVGSAQSLVPNPNPSGNTTLQPTFLKQHAAADLDGNGYDDVAAGAGDMLGVALTTDGALVPDPDSPFAINDAPSGNPNPQTVLSGDFNGDGALDVMTFSSHFTDEFQSRAIFPMINLPVLGDSQILDFGDLTAGQSDSLTATVTNAGGAPAIFDEDGVTVTGPDADQFTAVPESGCEDEIPAGESCDIEVTFTPTGGSATATLEVNYEAIAGNDGTFEVPLQGTGLLDPGITLSPATHDFGSAEIGGGGTRPSREFVVTSSGTTPVQVESVDLVPAGDDSFRIMDIGCEGELAPGSTCPVTVTFDPQQGDPGPRTAQLKVEGNDASATASLTGTATAKPTPPGPTPPGPNPPTPRPAALQLTLKSPKKAKRGKTLVVTATVTNVGESPSAAVTLRASAPKKRAAKPKPVRAGTLAAGAKVTKKIKVKVKKAAGKGKRLKVKVTASAPGTPAASATRTVKVR